MFTTVHTVYGINVDDSTWRTKVNMHLYPHTLPFSKSRRLYFSVYRRDRKNLPLHEINEFGGSIGIFNSAVNGTRSWKFDGTCFGGKAFLERKIHFVLFREKLCDSVKNQVLMSENSQICYLFRVRYQLN